MMIFNLWAIPVGGVIIAATLGLSVVAPQLMQGTLGNFIAGVLAVVIGGVAEFFGVKGRLFFMPIWFIGVLVIGFQLFEWMGIAGILLGIGLCAGAIYSMFYFAKATEARQWTRLQRQSFAEDAKFTESPGAYWNVVRKHLFHPTCIPYSPDIRAHNIAIVRHLLAWNGLGLSELETSVFKDFSSALTAMDADPKLKGPPVEISRMVRAIVDTKTKAAK